MPSQKLTTKPRDALPRHVAVVMDGNGRWAKQRHLPRLMGHQKGVEAVRCLIQECAKSHIPHLSLFAFSSENWNRPEEEVQGLMKLFLISLEKEIKSLHEAGVRVRLIGDLSRFSEQLQNKIKQAHELTKNNSGLTVNICVNYGGKWEIVQAIKRLVEAKVDTVDEKVFSEALLTPDSGDVDLFIRTSGEQRISNFLLWQSAYAELYFTDILWPDFSAEHFQTALDWYSGRQRRFGKTSEQIDQK